MDPAESAESADAASTFTTSTIHRTSSLLTTANPNGQLAPRPHVFIRTYRWLHSFSQATRCLIFICPFLLLMTLPVVIELVWFPGTSLGSVRIHYWAIYLMVCWTALFGSRVVISYIPNAIQWVLGVMTINHQRETIYG
ncbi:hypothetical protein BC936DRAFT_141400 [Jimgerdemannia flammicorona]|uniref:Mechanosensitive ion channel protein Msy1/2-like transmembrane domain-containing protein n=1 Tax=Jimgerdemannia flammicorona TaxID=994334 RepID=A0A433A2A9_9FUNG|nr:hypothetical protein BC936DRAFT_141400 [Jimgerdemannia flammicorona]